MDATTVEERRDAVAAVRALAERYHDGQTRDNKVTPYITHPAAVVERLRSWGLDEANGDEDAISLAVGWGHDLLEDTAITSGELEAVAPLGRRIAEGIRALTFHEPEDGWDRRQHGYKAEAKALYLTGVAVAAPPNILVVKIADRICNALERLKTDDRKALGYIRLGEPLLANVSRLPVRYAAAVERDFLEAFKTIETVNKAQDLWDMMTDDMDWAGKD